MPERVAWGLDQEDVHERDLVPVDSLVAEVVLGETLLADVERAVTADHEAPATGEGLAVALDVEVVAVGVDGRDLDAGLNPGVKRSVHRVLRHAVERLLCCRQTDVGVDVLQEDLGAVRDADRCNLEVQGLAVGDLPRRRVVLGRICRLHGDWIAVELVVDHQLAALEVVAQDLQGVGVHHWLLAASAAACHQAGDKQQQHQPGDARETKPFHFQPSSLENNANIIQ